MSTTWTERLEARATELERKAAHFRKHYPKEALTADLEDGLALASDLRAAVAAEAELKTRTVENECMQASLQAITAKYQAVEAAAKAVTISAWTDRWNRLHAHPSVVALEHALVPAPAAEGE